MAPRLSFAWPGLLLPVVVLACSADPFLAVGAGGSAGLSGASGQGAGGSTPAGGQAGQAGSAEGGAGGGEAGSTTAGAGGAAEGGAAGSEPGGAAGEAGQAGSAQAGESGQGGGGGEPSGGQAGKGGAAGQSGAGGQGGAGAAGTGGVTSSGGSGGQAGQGATGGTGQGGASAGGQAGAGGTTSACAVGQTSCSGICVDLQDDPQHCGHCPRVCGSGLCQEGVCVGKAGDELDGTMGSLGVSTKGVLFLANQRPDGEIGVRNLSTGFAWKVSNNAPPRGVLVGDGDMSILTNGDALLVYSHFGQPKVSFAAPSTDAFPTATGTFRGVAYNSTHVAWTGRQGYALCWRLLLQQNLPVDCVSMSGETGTSGLAINAGFAYYLTSSELRRTHLGTGDTSSLSTHVGVGSSVVAWQDGVVWANNQKDQQMTLRFGKEGTDDLLLTTLGQVADLWSDDQKIYVLVDRGTQQAAQVMRLVDKKLELMALLPVGVTVTSLVTTPTYFHVAAHDAQASKTRVYRAER